MASQQVMLEPYEGQWSPDDKDASFKEEVALYSRMDPMPVLERMSREMNIPVGALTRYVLVKWAASGSEALMELGPRVVQQMAEVIREAEDAGTDPKRLETYHKLSGIISWLQVPLTGSNRAHSS